jgi:hypothetical protein
VTVSAVVGQILRNPTEHLIRRWNWKSALFSPVLRALIFFFANLAAGWRAASAAALVELLYRGPTAGVYGALTQAFRRADPPWAAGLTVMLLLPLLSHSFEAMVHFWRGTPKLGTSIFASICFTALSTLFNLYAMRRGVLITGGEEEGTFFADLRRIPITIALFVAAGPQAIFHAAKWLRTLWMSRARIQAPAKGSRKNNSTDWVRWCSSTWAVSGAVASEGPGVVGG